MSEIHQTKSGKFAIFDKDGKLIGTSDSSDDWWDDSNCDDDPHNNYDQKQTDRGEQLEVGGYNDNFEEIEMPDKKRGVEVKNPPIVW